MKIELKASIRRQFALIVIGLLAGTILLCWFINNTFLEKYYLSNKTKVIMSVYEEIRIMAAKDVLGTWEVAEDLNELCFQNNIATFVFDANSRAVFSSGNGGDELGIRLFGYLINMPEASDSYILQKTRGRENEYLEMYGALDNRYSFIIRTPMESIRESANIANRFLAYIGLVMAVLSGALVWILSKKITDPILELTNISERMIHLDFEAKYHGSSNNEISMLGENINKLSASLERTISELKTANNELKKDIGKKEQIDEMRQEFLSNVSHELKTPIALIQGYAEGLREGINDDPESREFYCDVIMDEASKMNNMVKKLLTLNQLEFGNELVSMERFDVTALISNYIQSAQILTKQNGIEVRFEYEEPVYVWADEFKTEEVFMNYFTNAVNHCQGKKVIDVRVEKEEGKARISVFNTGEPIPEDAVGHLWEKFYKVDKARTREYGGSGVGLSIVKAIMESMNQAYGVQNYTNGVQFWFELETVREDG